MTEAQLGQLGKTLWAIADYFRDYMLSFLFLRYLSDNFETAARKELGADYHKPDDGDDKRASLAIWYASNADDVLLFEIHMRRKMHYVIRPGYSSAAT